MEGLYRVILMCVIHEVKLVNSHWLKCIQFLLSQTITVRTSVKVLGSDKPIEWCSCLWLLLDASPMLPLWHKLISIFRIRWVFFVNYALINLIYFYKTKLSLCHYMSIIQQLKRWFSGSSANLKQNITNSICSVKTELKKLIIWKV